MDLFHVVLNWVDHNRYKVLSLLLVMACLIYGVGCGAMTGSMVGDGKVGRSQFMAEAVTIESDLALDRIAIDAQIAAHNERVMAHNVRIEAGVADLDHQDEIKAELFNLVGSAVTAWASGGVPISGLIGTGLTALGLIGGFGALQDGRRKDKVIEQSKRAPVMGITEALDAQR